jgi:BirA family transcriptional regulator, biotin operon repressor / biotin---[acetyl-CoA-carboxylase] ligase
MSAFDVARFEALRRGELGVPIRWRDRTESTSDDALAAAKQGAAHGAVFGAETQTHGRGRRGSEWVSAPGEGLWFSVLLRPALSAELVSGLALAAGLAVRDAVAARIAADAKIKWPNDVLVDGRKICGVLVESQMSGASISSAIVGIGINVAQRTFPPELRDIATSLALLDGAPRARESLLADTLAALQTRVEILQQRGMSGLAEELRGHDALLGLSLWVDERRGTGAGIDDAGRLRLRLADGTIEPQLSGHVQIAR